MNKVKYFQKSNPVLSIEWLDAIFFDFDGVLTDNRVYIDQDGHESVCCNRGDGLAFDVLKKTRLKLFILSREKNPIVHARGAKLKIPVISGVMNKECACRRLTRSKNLPLARLLFVGNDLNDYDAMQLCGFSACPADSHPEIKRIAQIVLKSKGGEGVVAELVEHVLRLDMLKYLREEKNA